MLHVHVCVIMSNRSSVSTVSWLASQLESPGARRLGKRETFLCAPERHRMVKKKKNV